MALIVARMMHFFPALTDRDCLAMPMRRFMVLFRSIAQVQANEDLRKLYVAHADPERYSRMLEGISSGTESDVLPEAGILSVPGAELAEDSELMATRQRQLDAERQLRAQHAKQANT